MTIYWVWASGKLSALFEGLLSLPGYAAFKAVWLELGEVRDNPKSLI